MGHIARVEHTYPYKIKDIWQALTTPRLIKEWCLQTNFKLKKGEPFYLRDTSRKKELVVQCKLLDFEEHKSLTYIWGASHESSLVSFTLSETNEGTKLVVEHSGFQGVSGFFAARNFSGVWKKMIKFSLPEVMEKNFKKIKDKR